jgi:hypothetical protein
MYNFQFCSWIVKFSILFLNCIIFNIHLADRSLKLKRCRLRLKCDGTCAETRFHLSAKRTSPFKSVGASVQSTTGSQVVRISGSNAGYTTFRGSVKGTGYPLHSPVSPSFPLPCGTVCHHISTGLYHEITRVSLSLVLGRFTTLLLHVTGNRLLFDCCSHKPHPHRIVRRWRTPLPTSSNQFFFRCNNERFKWRQ